jgi:hypothetical protein
MAVNPENPEPQIMARQLYQARQGTLHWYHLNSSEVICAFTPSDICTSQSPLLVLFSNSFSSQHLLQGLQTFSKASKSSTSTSPTHEHLFSSTIITSSIHNNRHLFSLCWKSLGSYFTTINSLLQENHRFFFSNAANH